MKISYYELLTKIKDFETEEQYPKVYWYNNYRDKVLYVPCFDCVDGSFDGYHIENRNLENDDIRYWLSECMLESSMFDKTIEILEVEDKEYEDIEEIDVALLGQCDNWLRCPTNEVTKQDIELNPYIIDNVRENTLKFQCKINTLIRNQKKIIERLDK